MAKKENDPVEDYKLAQKKIRELEKEIAPLSLLPKKLEESEKETKAEQEKNVTLQKQYNDLLSKSKDLEKAAEGYEDPKELKNALSEAKNQLSANDKKIGELQKQVGTLTREKQDLLSEDDRSSEAMKQVQEKEKRIITLENELEAVKKKMAKYEGDFRFPGGGTPLLSVPMGEGNVTEFVLYEMKGIPASPPMVLKVETRDGRAVSVDFEKA